MSIKKASLKYPGIYINEYKNGNIAYYINYRSDNDKYFINIIKGSIALN